MVQDFFRQVFRVLTVKRRVRASVERNRQAAARLDALLKEILDQ